MLIYIIIRFKVTPNITSIYYVNLHNNTLQITPNITSIYYVNLHNNTLQITPNITLYAHNYVNLYILCEST